MSAYLQLYLDVFNRRLPLTLSNQSAFTGLSNAYQYGKLKFRIYPVRPNGNVTGTLYSVLDLDNLTLKMGIGAKAGGEDLLAYTAPGSWSKVYDSGSSGPGYFSGDLDLNTTEMNTAIGSASSVASFFEIQLGDSSDYRTAYSAAITVNATVMTGGAASAIPDPADEYYTKSETSGLFVPRSGSESITLVSPDGTWQRVLGVDNDGNAIDDLIPV
jgi:hypothetical protein